MSSPGLTGRSSTPRHIGSSTAVSGIPDAPLEAGHDSGDCHEHFPTRASAPSRRWGVRVLEEIPPSVNRGRREGRVPAAPAAPVHKKKHGEGTTGVGGIIRPSLRNGFNAYVALSLGTGLSCSHRPRSSRELGLSVGRPGPHDFASASAPFVRTNESHASPKRPSHPAPNVRDDREAPLLIERGTVRTILLIYGRRQDAFCKSECAGLRQIGTSGSFA